MHTHVYTTVCNTPCIDVLICFNRRRTNKRPFASCVSNQIC